MPTQQEMVQEAEKRGLIDPRMRSLIDEANKRGLITQPETAPIEGTIPEPGPGVMQEGIVPETTPLQPPETVPITPEIAPMEGPAFPEAIPFSVRRAADAGIEFDKPAPAGHALQSFALNEAERVRAFKLSLQQHFGKPVEVRRGKDTGELEYLNPETGRFALVSPPGSGGLSGLAGPGVVFGAETAGSIPGMLAGPFSVAFGAGAGAAYGEMQRLLIGQSAGINQNMTDSDIAKAMATEAAFVTGGGIVADRALRVAKGVLNIARGRGLTDKIVKDLDISTEEASALERTINDRVDGAKFRFSLGQATNDEDILGLEDLYKRSKEYRKQFGEFRNEQRGAINSFYQKINEPFRSRLDDPATAEAVKGVADTQLDRSVRRADLNVALKESELDNALTSLQARPRESLGPTLRETGTLEQESFRTWAKEAADELDRSAGGAEFIPNQNLHQVASALDEETQRNLFQVFVRPQRGVIGPRVTGQEAVPEDIRALRESVTGDPGPEVNETLNKLFDPNAQFTFSELWDSISVLKRASRDASRGLTTEVPSTASLNRLIQAAETDLRAGTARSPLGEQYEQFINRYRAEKLRVDEGVVAQMMERRGGRNGSFRVADEAVFNSVIVPGPNSRRTAGELFALIRNDPQAMTATREAMTDFYKKKVVPDGRVDLRKHKQFMEDYNGALSVFFTKAERKQLARPGQIEGALRSREAARDRAVTAINKSFEADVSNLDSTDKLVRFAMKDSGSARKMTELLKNTPDVLRSFKASVRKDMSERIAGEFKDGERFFSAPKFNDYLFGKAGEKGKGQALAAVFGDQYVEDLTKLSRAISIAARESSFPNRSNTAFWTDTVKNLSRAYVGLFTRPGRVITALDRLRGRASSRVFVNATLNPADLRQLMQMQGVDLRTKKAAAAVGALGGTALSQDFE